MKTILVVDDDEAIRTLLQEELKDEGYQVLIAANARDALKKVEEEALDLVILDIRMPGMDGLEALPRILGLKEGLPVILNTAYTQYQESFMSWAADAYVVKSSDLTELKAKVKELIKMMDGLKELTTIIMAGGKGERLFPLTRDKAKPAITFGSLYRIIDFTLSNCLNCGIRRIYVLTQYGSFSLDQHLRAAWDIMHPDLGEFIYSMPPQQIMVSRWYRGTADSIYQNLNLLQQERPQQVLILSGDHVYKMNYLEMLDFHLSRDADMTVAAVPVPRQEASSFGILKVDAATGWRIFWKSPPGPRVCPAPPTSPWPPWGSTFSGPGPWWRRSSRTPKRRAANTISGRDIIPQMVGRKKVFAYQLPERQRPAALLAGHRPAGRLL